MSVEVSVAPAVTAIALDDLKTHLRITGTNRDTYLTDEIIPIVVAEAEDKLEAGLIDQTLIWRLDSFASSRGELDDFWYREFPTFPRSAVEMLLPRHPVTAVTQVRYQNPVGTWNVIDAADYEVDIYSKPGRLRPLYGTQWPQVANTLNAVEVTFTAGYGAAATDVPARLRQWMYMAAGHYNEHPEGTTVCKLEDVPGWSGILADFGRTAML